MNMQLMLGKEILDAKMIHSNQRIEESYVKDILLNMDFHKLGYLVLKITNPDRKLDQGENDNFWVLLNIFEDSDDPEKQTFVIPDRQIEQMEKGAIYMKGQKTEAERELEAMDCPSIATLQNVKVSTESEQTLGKVKDVVFDVDDRKIAGLQLEQGLENHKQYMPYEDISSWKKEKITVKDSLPDKLVDEPGEIFNQ